MWRQTGVAPERAGEVTLIREARRGRYIRRTAIAAHQLLRGSIQSQAAKVGRDGDAMMPAKLTREMRRVHRGDRRKLSDCEPT